MAVTQTLLVTKIHKKTFLSIFSVFDVDNFWKRYRHTCGPTYAQVVYLRCANFINIDPNFRSNPLLYFYINLYLIFCCFGPIFNWNENLHNSVGRLKTHKCVEMT